MRNPSEVVFAILSLHWIASSLRSAAEQGVPTSRVLHAVHELTSLPSSFVLQGCAAYERQLAYTIDEHPVLHFARGAFAHTGNETITPEVADAANDFFWAWDGFFREILKLGNPPPPRLAQAFEDVEDLPYLLLREGPEALRDALHRAPKDRPELAAMVRSYEA